MDHSVCVQVMLLLSFLIMLKHHMSAQDLDECVLSNKFHCFV